MPEWLLSVLLVAGAVGSAVVGGLYFGFSTSVMGALDRQPPGHAVAAMKAINEIILNPAFFIAFFGPAVISAVLLVVSFFRLADPATPFVIAGALLYLAGSFGVTMAINVPLNDRLAALSSAEEMEKGWRDYSRPWTWWNSFRTWMSALAALAFILALIA